MGADGLDQRPEVREHSTQSMHACAPDTPHPPTSQAGEFVYAQITMKGGVLEWGPGDHAQMGLPPPAPGYDPEVGRGVRA